MSDFDQIDENFKRLKASLDRIASRPLPSEEVLEKLRVEQPLIYTLLTAREKAVKAGIEITEALEGIRPSEEDSG